MLAMMGRMDEAASSVAVGFYNKFRIQVMSMVRLPTRIAGGKANLHQGEIEDSITMV